MRRITDWFLAVGVVFTSAGVPFAWAGTIQGSVHTASPQGPKGVVVYVEGVQGTFTPSPEPHVVDQKGKVYVPSVLPVLKGEQVTFTNSDPFLHNVHAFLGRKTLFNAGMPTGSKPVTKTFDQVGEIALLCNVHPEMEGWVVVRDNPYFTVTDSAGHYRIERVPSGTYSVKAWQPKLGEGLQSVSVPAEGEVTCDLELHSK